MLRLRLLLHQSGDGFTPVQPPSSYERRVSFAISFPSKHESDVLHDFCRVTWIDLKILPARMRSIETRRIAQHLCKHACVRVTTYSQRMSVLHTCASNKEKDAGLTGDNPKIILHLRSLAKMRCKKQGIQSSFPKGDGLLRLMDK